MRRRACVYQQTNQNITPVIKYFQNSRRSRTESGCVPFGDSKNGFLILDLPDFAGERNVKSEIGFVTLVTFRQRTQYARQPLKK